MEILALVGLGLMFYRDWKAYKTSRKLPALADYVPDWIPAFPFSLTGPQEKKRKKSISSNSSKKK